jgi:hypothetical protein
MADNLTTTTTVATIPNNTVIATDDAGAGGHVQIVKLALSTDGSATPITADANGLEVQLGTAIPAGTNNIGDVDVLSVIPGTGATNLGKAIDTAMGATDTGVAILAKRDDALSTLTAIEGDCVPLHTDSTGSLWATLSAAAEVIGTTAHDAADANAPVKIGAKAETSMSGITLVADGDRTDIYAAEDGVLYSRPYPANPADTWDVSTSTTATTDVTLKAAGAAGVRTYITSITVTNVHAATNTHWGIKDGATALTSPRWVGPAPAAGGYTFTFNPPLRGAAATAWTFATGAGVTTIYVSATGYQSKV